MEALRSILCLVKGHSFKFTARNIDGYPVIDAVCSRCGLAVSNGIWCTHCAEDRLFVDGVLYHSDKHKTTIPGGWANYVR